MATYEYQCYDHGHFEVTRALGTSPESIECPVCESDSMRVFSKPMLSFSNPALVAAIEHSEKSRDEPEVVTSLPPETGAQAHACAAADSHAPTPSQAMTS